MGATTQTDENEIKLKISSAQEPSVSGGCRLSEETGCFHHHRNCR